MTETIPRSWWTRGRPFTRTELWADGLVHALGIAIAMGLGLVLLRSAIESAAHDFPALAIYLVSLVVVLSVSLAFNLCPITSPLKRPLARLDQAAIFLFIAASYTPYLLLLGPTPVSITMGAIIWGAALTGMALKLIVPHRFGRRAMGLYLAIGWSGLAVIGQLASALSAASLALLIAGGVVYSLGLVFHLWERLRFHNALWHLFVVTGASLHLLALFESFKLPL